MQILLAVIYGAAVGAVAHFTLPGRDLRGAALGPMLGAVVAALVWTALTWAGAGLGSPVLWATALVVPPAVVYGGIAGLVRARRAHDRRERERLGLG